MGLLANSVFKPNSNVQFGEGGAGTFSDGKLYSQIKDKRHPLEKVLTEFVKAGAPEEILHVAKPHIGTFRLVKIVENMRATIESLGGEFRFQTKVTDLVLENKRVTGVKLHDDHSIASNHIVLAVDTVPAILSGCFGSKASTSKPNRSQSVFASSTLNLLIDGSRWGDSAGHELLGAADYRRSITAKTDVRSTAFACARVERS